MPILALQPEQLDLDATLVSRLDQYLDRLFPCREVRRVLLVAPPDGDAGMFDFAVARRHRYWNHPQYGLGLVASVLRAGGYEVHLLNLNHVVLKACWAAPSADAFDFTAVVEQALADELAAFQPDIVGVTCMYSQAHRSLQDTSAAIRRLYPGVPIAVGGVHVTNSFIDLNTREAFLKSLEAVDLVFLYESEYAFRVFLDAAAKRGGHDGLGQMALLHVGDGDEHWHLTPWTRPQNQDLDIIPAYDLMDVAETSEVGRVGAFYSLKDKGTRFATILLGRGCRFQCTFCSVRRFNGVGVRTRSVESVIEELKVLKGHGIDHVTWLDDDFFYDPKRVVHICNEMVRLGLDMTWDCSNGVVAASCTEELMSAAAASGCIGLYLGVESGNPLVLKQIRKPGTVDKFLRAAELLRRHETIHGRAFLIIGFPGETYRMLMDTYNLCREMDIDWCHINIFQALPNTPLFQEMVAARAGEGKPADLTDIRFNSGGYGKRGDGKSQPAQRQSVFAVDFEEAFSGVGDLDTVPSPQELERVWAYMNYHVNFARMFKESRPGKIAQNFRYIRNITEVVDPDNAFAWWFSAFLSQRLTTRVDHALIDQTEALLARLPVWRERFDRFGLSVADLRRGDISRCA